ncbi:hypothetical protein CRUP_018916 [Coryphaenoides rupestris]|nr:hypothetical protein CRUP_018916 [Coryphaenoides rupestris]
MGEKTLGADGRARPGSSVDTVWVDISNPVDADRGNFARQTSSSAVTIHNVSMEDSGKYTIQVRNQHGGEAENYEEFLKAMVLESTGDFVITSKTPGKSVTNSFTIGKEADITTMDGKKIKCTVTMEGGKMICNTGKFCHVQELKGEEMIEVSLIQPHPGPPQVSLQQG